MFEVYALPDEYFLVLERLKRSELGTRYSKYWKCDQLEGLVKFFQDKGILKK